MDRKKTILIGACAAVLMLALVIALVVASCSGKQDTVPTGPDTWIEIPAGTDAGNVEEDGEKDPVSNGEDNSTSGTDATEGNSGNGGNTGNGGNSGNGGNGGGSADPTESTQASDPVESTQASDPVESTQASDPVESTQASDPVESTQASDPAETEPEDKTDKVSGSIDWSDIFKGNGN